MEAWQPPKRGGAGKGQGRPHGSRNKVPSEVVDDIVSAYRQLGGVQYLVNIGEKRPDLFFGLLGKILPKNIKAEIDMKPVVKVIDLSGTPTNDNDIRIQDQTTGGDVS